MCTWWAISGRDADTSLPFFCSIDLCASQLRSSNFFPTCARDHNSCFNSKRRTFTVSRDACSRMTISLRWESFSVSRRGILLGLPLSSSSYGLAMCETHTRYFALQWSPWRRWLKLLTEVKCTFTFSKWSWVCLYGWVTLRLQWSN